MKQKNKLPELLSPAGSPEALRAAIEGGADAVYIGGVAFNARINAKNFTPEDIREGARIAHAYGAKLYVAANTLIYDKEAESFLRAAEDAYLCGADALIVADIGCARLIRDRIPIELHASTQLSGHNVSAAKRLYEAGFSRMVCAREMSEADLCEFTAESPIEAEVFVHGALCVCHSGQCLFSSAVGGRSGNRGECAQPCRLPYRVGEGKRAREAYPLSLKDLSLARHIPKLIDMGVASLKIEGRMKSPEYVRDVTRIWRRLLDGHRAADDADMAELSRIFSRGGFTDAYFTRTDASRLGRGMLGVRSEGDKESSRMLMPFTGITRKIPISLTARIRMGQPMELCVDGRDITVLGSAPEQARTAPTDSEAVRRSLSKWGNTPYEVKNISLELDSGLMVPVSALNALRRDAASALDAACSAERSESDITRQKKHPVPQGVSEPMRTAVFYDPTGIPDAAREYFDIIYAPLDRYDGSVNGVMLPAVIYDSERESIEKLLAAAYEKGARHVLVGNLGHISLAERSGMTLHGDLRLNITNNASAAVYESLGFADAVLSPELTLPQLRDIGGRGITVVYGRLPLMVTEKCVTREIADCRTCESGRAELVDRRGARFPVLRDAAHRSLIFNSVPVYMADRMQALEGVGIIMHHYIFTTESRKDVERVINAYRNSEPPLGNVRRIK